MKNIKGVTRFIEGSTDTFRRREPKIKERAGILLALRATSNLSKKVKLIKWVRKDLENSIVDFTGYLNSCVCLHQMLYTECFGRNIYYFRAIGSFFMAVGGGRGLSKNSSHHGSPTTKVYKKEHWLKHPKVVPKKKNWTYI